MLWPIKKLGEVLDYEQPTKYLVSSRGYKDEFTTPVLTAGKTFILGNTNEKKGIFPKEKLPVIIFDDFTTATKFVDFPFKVKSSAMKILHAKKGIADAKYLFYLIQTIKFSHKQHKRYWISEYSQLEISFPPIEEQKKIVKKIEKLFAKIDEASRLREESSIDAAALLSSALQQVFSREKWPIKKLGEICEVIAGQSPEGKFYNKAGEGLPFYQGKKEFTDKFIGSPTTWTTSITKEAQAGDILMSVRAPVGPINFASERICIGRGLASIRPIKDIDPDFLFHFLKNIESKIIGNLGAVFSSINKKQIEEIGIPHPPIAEQRKIVAYLDSLSKKTDDFQNIQRETAADFFALRQSILASAFAQ